MRSSWNKWVSDYVQAADVSLMQQLCFYLYFFYLEFVDFSLILLEESEPAAFLSNLPFLCRCVGINMVKRKLATHDNLKITFQQDGNTFHIKESSNFRNLEMDFTLGVTFDYSLADGTELSVSKRGLKTCWHNA